MWRGALYLAGCLAMAGGAMEMVLAGAASPVAAQGLLAIKQMERDYMALVPLEVHQRPSEGSEKIEHLKEDTRFLVTGHVTGTKWFRLITGNRRLGYVLGDLTQPAPEKGAIGDIPARPRER